MKVQQRTLPPQKKTADVYAMIEAMYREVKTPRNMIDVRCRACDDKAGIDGDAGGEVINLLVAAQRVMQVTRQLQPARLLEWVCARCVNLCREAQAFVGGRVFSTLFSINMRNCETYY